MKRLIFISIFIFFLSQFLNAQDNIKNEINIYLDKNINTLQELNSKLVDEYGLNNIQFVKLENGRYIPVKANEVKKISEVQVSSDVILVFAIIGAVLVALLLLRAL
ncbi:MAG: hypothetical protein NTU73_01090 [Ignavibacteriae bacterium]|nr:hypothetical protein [Ignavibacteriota bacterium]